MARISDSESVSFEEPSLFVGANFGSAVIWTCGGPNMDERRASGSLSDSLRSVVKLICGCAESEEGPPGIVGGWEIVITEEVDAGLFEGEVSDHLYFKGQC